MQQAARPPRKREYDLTGFPPEAVEEARAIMAELDVIHPGWLDYAPYMYPFERRARVTWCLYRLDKQVLRHEGRKPAPRLDWRVRIVKAGPRDPDQSRAFPHPVLPGQDWHPSWYEPPPLKMTAKPVGPSATELAFDLEMPLERVERILRNCPEGKPPRAHLIDVRDRTNPRTPQ